MLFTDDLGQELNLVSYPPRRILSVVPSLTELLYDLGLEEEIVGITKFCVFPEVIFRSKPRIGGTKTLHLDKIRALQPDLIIANKEENQQEDIQQLSAEFPTYVTDIQLMSQAVEKIKIIGELSQRKTESLELIDKINDGFTQLARFERRPRVAYMIWKDPIMVAGGDTYIHDMLDKAGFENAFGHLSRYPSVEATELANAEIDFVLLSSEPFPFKTKDLAYFEKLMPSSKAILVDGTMFSWYGSRLALVPSYFKKLREDLKI